MDPTEKDDGGLNAHAVRMDRPNRCARKERGVS
jgi:hypothetical protein